MSVFPIWLSFCYCFIYLPTTDSAVQLRSIYIAIKQKTQGSIRHDTIIKIYMYQSYNRKWVNRLIL